jgi:hypothetical protein
MSQVFELVGAMSRAKLARGQTRLINLHNNSKY